MSTVIKVTLLKNSDHMWNQWFEQRPWDSTDSCRSVLHCLRCNSWTLFDILYVWFVCWSTHYVDVCYVTRTSIHDSLFDDYDNVFFDKQVQLWSSWWQPTHLENDWPLVRFLHSEQTFFSLRTFFYLENFKKDSFFNVTTCLLREQNFLRTRHSFCTEHRVCITCNT